MMLGVYDYTVVLTYVSVLISMGGMLFSVNGYPRMAIVCLALSGFCDMFDGKIARTKKNRTEVEKKFGIQIDSLADIICFGVGPTLICISYGNEPWYRSYDSDVLCAGRTDPSGMV